MRRFRIEEAWELDGYRVARPLPLADERPEPGSPEAAELDALAAEVTALAAQWLDRVKCAQSGSSKSYSPKEEGGRKLSSEIER